MNASRHLSLKVRRVVAAASVAATAGAAVIGALPATAHADTLSSHSPAHVASYHFATHNDPSDPTFNQLLGVNDAGVIAGYFGSGNPAATHPNKGYTLTFRAQRPHYANENFPGSSQTQVTAINRAGDTVGFYVTSSGDTFGFIRHHGVFSTVADQANPVNNQLLGINNRGSAVGFYTDGAGNTHGYRYDTWDKKFTPISVKIAGTVSTQATGINDRGDISGFATDGAGNQTAFLLTHGHGHVTIEAPGSKMTQAFGVNNLDQVVGQYIDGSGATHGFVWAAGHLKTVDDPHGVGTTTVNGINNRGEIVGFYTDANTNVDGFTAVWHS